MTNRSLPLTRPASPLMPVAYDSRPHALESGHFSTETTPQKCVSVLATLIDGAIATFDADRNASRLYLMRASAILRARATHASEHAAERRSRGELAHWRLTRVVDYVEQHLSERIRGEDLADLIGVSTGQLFRAFKASVGIAPLHYVASRRLDRVCLLLRTTQEPLSQIAVSTGFCDQSHLCRVFRRLLGVTPAAWRRDNAEGPDAQFGSRPKQIMPIAAPDLRGARHAKIEFAAQCAS